VSECTNHVIIHR